MFPWYLFQLKTNTQCGCNIYTLIDTEYSFNKKGCNYGINGWYNFAGDIAKFEEVLDNCPKEIQEQLLFHLDFFTKEHE